MHKLNQIDQLSNDIAALEEEAREKKMMREQLTKLDSPYVLAITLHAQLCLYNHTDACSWHYTKDTDSQAWKTDITRIKYLATAKRILEVTDMATAMMIVNALEL